MRFPVLCIVLIGAAVSFLDATNLEVLLREISELEERERDERIDQRLGEVMELLMSPLDTQHLFQRRSQEGDVCDDGIVATCNGPVRCDENGQEYCRALCDSSDHGGQAHFFCKCKRGEYYGLLCDIKKEDVDGKCTQCKSQGGHYCYATIVTPQGYLCYDKSFKKMEVTERGLVEDPDATADGDTVGRIAHILREFIKQQN